jgi:hypothetical protein
MSTSGRAADVLGAGDAVVAVAAGTVLAAGGVAGTDVTGAVTDGLDDEASAGDKLAALEADGDEPDGVALGET